ncbi:MAG: hypothetical protein GY703_18125 [Gammaproteobacteria bacterium]|nr:hypothetical protein [Gammaproteobacteria bacterium]
MNSAWKREVRGALGNLRSGAALLLLRRKKAKDFYVSPDQIFVLVALLTSVMLIGGYVANLPRPEFNIFGIAEITTSVCLLGLCAYLLSRLSGESSKFTLLFTLLISLWTVLNVIAFAIGEERVFSLWYFRGDLKHFYLLLNIWLTIVVVTSTVRLFDVNKRKRIQVLLIYAATFAVPMNAIFFGNLWMPGYSGDDSYEKYSQINEELTYYRQIELIDETKNLLMPHRKEVSDIYFVGFGSYAYQDVFMKEVLYAQNVLDEHYDTKGRSAVLINNVKTVEDIPLANKSNLNLLLKHIGNLIDPEEDILFLYLTSHGSKNQELSVDLMPLSLNDIRPSDLSDVLGNSGIKYKVLLVSACYSGGFIEPLKDENTIIFTAARKDKTSFGCSNTRELTYFGEAIFKNHMKNDYNFISAFEKSIRTIQSMEGTKQLDHSDPQLFVGDQIREKVAVIADDMRQFNSQ